MGSELFAILALLIAAATIIQSLTGFGFGLFVISSVTLLTPVPVSTTAFLISVLSLVNASEMAFRHRNAIQKPAAKLILLFGLPSVGVGFWLLEWLSAADQSLLMMVLGLCILGCSLLLLLRRAKLTTQSHSWQFALAGGLGGILGGLFSTFGPPVVFQCYRQPWQLEQIRATLLFVFSLAALVRLLLVPFGNQPDTDMLLFTLLAVPLVMIATRVARSIATHIATEIIRAGAVFLLALSGMSLLLKAMLI